MIRNSTVTSKIWKRCMVKKFDGSVLNVCFMNLPRDRTDDLVDFQMTQFVPRELTHQISGLPNNKDAMAEYRVVLKAKLSNPSIVSIICCQEKDNKIIPEIIACDTMKLVKRYDPSDDDIPPNLKTKEAKDYFRILRDWNNLYPVPDILKTFNIERFFDDRGVATHRDFSGYGFTYHFSTIRRDVCQAYGVPMTGAWMTSYGTAKASSLSGWEVLYEISREELEKVLNITIDSKLSSYRYSVLRV